MGKIKNHVFMSLFASLKIFAPLSIVKVSLTLLSLIAKIHV